MKILIIGTGYIAQEYLKVIANLKIECDIVGRGENNLNKTRERYPQFKYFSGGIEKFLKQKAIIEYSHFINLVNIEYSLKVTQLLLNHGAKNILLEKPGGLDIKEFVTVERFANGVNAKVAIGYNRRFYESVKELVSLSNEDGGIQNIHFEFTEWVHTINEEDFSIRELNKWVIANSSHVIDTVFYLIGLPDQLNPIVSGQNRINWHKSGSIFSGSGRSLRGIPFTYNTNWTSAGRWAIEVTSRSKRFYLKPMEALSVQNRGEMVLETVELPQDKDRFFKPGLFDQVVEFLSDKNDKLLSINEQIQHIEIYEKIGGY